jgi:predicted NBD/HSP70 family sugar kinase
VQGIVIGGGFQASRIGTMAVGRAALLLQDEGHKLRIDAIGNDPDHAGLIGAAHLLPPWMLKGYKSILAIDIGGTNIRAGIVALNLNKAALLADAEVVKLEHWRHADDEPNRRQAVDRIVAMLASLIAWAEKNDMKLAPLIGIGCPGTIKEDGTIERGAQNLPGNWEADNFNLPALIREAIPKIGDHETLVAMHNDAVVQGLSEVPNFRDCPRWGVLTIGTGLGNACFSNRDTEAPARQKKD